MTRNPKIERSLDLWYQFENSAESESAKCLLARNEAILAQIAGTPHTVNQVLNTFHNQFVEFKKERRRQERLASAQRS